jgi:hypothetical protein
MANVTQKIFEASAPGRLGCNGWHCRLFRVAGLTNANRSTNPSSTFAYGMIMYVPSKAESAQEKLSRAEIDYRDYLKDSHIDYTFAKEKFLANRKQPLDFVCAGLCVGTAKRKGYTFYRSGF